MTPDQLKLQDLICTDMRAHPEQFLWLWKKVLTRADGTPIPEAEIRAFWGIAPDADCPP